MENSELIIVISFLLLFYFIYQRNSAPSSSLDSNVVKTPGYASPFFNGLSLTHNPLFYFQKNI